MAEGGVRKQYLDLLGEPVLAWAVRAFAEHPAIEATVVVLPPEDAAEAPSWLRADRVRVVAGGAERSDSVRNGLAVVDPGTDIVLVHDGARPARGRRAGARRERPAASARARSGPGPASRR